MCTEPGGPAPRRRPAGARAAAAVAAGLFALPSIDAALAQDEPPPAGWAEAIMSGKPGLDLRYRFEYVDQDGVGESAEASTLRLRLNYGTAAYRDLSAFVEFDYVAELLFDNFNSGGGTSPGRSQYPVVADPHGGDLNQLYVDFGGIEDTLLRVGRQRILLDNHRFVGDVGWRQNVQTYDGLTAVYDGIAGLDIHYSYVTRVNRIFGDRSPVGRDDSNTHLLNLRFELPDDWIAVPYAYLIDDDDVATFSSLTLGARLAGAIDVGERKMSMTGEVATQTDAGNAPVAYRAHYLRFDLSVPLAERFTVGLGYELLDGDDDSPGEAFRTPLATLHAFQGWADQFLATPDAGIEDFFLSAGFAPRPWKLSATWHSFAAADGPADWGSEIDFSASRPLGDRYGLLLKAAFFDADDPAFSDVTKLWVMLTAGF